MGKVRRIMLDFDESGDTKTMYVHFRTSLEGVRRGQSKRQVTFDGFGSDEAKKEGIELVVDFDEMDNIIGIEILSNRDVIPVELKD